VNEFHVVFISTFTEGLLQKTPSIHHTTSDSPPPWHHMPRSIVMHVVVTSILKIFEYAAKQACKQLQSNKAKLSEPVLNLALCYGTIWRHREKPQYRCTTTTHPVYKCSKKILENLLPVWLFGAHKLLHSEPFLDYRYEFWHLLSAPCSDLRKIFYI